MSDAVQSVRSGCREEAQALHHHQPAILMLMSGEGGRERDRRGRREESGRRMWRHASGGRVREGERERG